MNITFMGLSSHDVCRAPSDGRVDQRDDERDERDEDDQEVDHHDRDVLAAGNIFAAPRKFKGAGDPMCICHGLIAVFRGVERSRIGADGVSKDYAGEARAVLGYSEALLAGLTSQ